MFLIKMKDFKYNDNKWRLKKGGLGVLPYAMIKKNKKRAETTYLTMIDGEVVKTDTAYPKEDDVMMEENKSFHEHNDNVEKTKPKGKFRVLSLISICLILIPFLFLGFKLGATSINEIQNFSILEGGNSENTSVNNPNVTDILDVINKFNQSMTISYNGLKDEVLLFVNNKSSSYSIKKSITTRISTLESNRDYILKKESLFMEADQEALFELLVERVDTLLSFLNSYSNNLSRSNAVNSFNEQIIFDNNLLQNEISLIKTFLTSNNISYSSNENQIKLK